MAIANRPWRLGSSPAGRSYARRQQASLKRLAESVLPAPGLEVHPFAHRVAGLGRIRVVDAGVDFAQQAQAEELDADEHRKGGEQQQRVAGHVDAAAELHADGCAPASERQHDACQADPAPNNFIGLAK